MPLAGVLHARSSPVPPTVYVLYGEAPIGVYSSNEKAIQQAETVVAQDLGRRFVKLPAWAPTLGGGLSVMVEREGRTWRFRVEPWQVDAEA